MQRHRVAAVAALLLALAGCQSSATINSQVVATTGTPTLELHRLSVLENIHGALDWQNGHPYDEFEDAFTKTMQGCGVTTQYFRVKTGKLDLDTDAKLQAARADAARANPDATLTLDETSERILGDPRVPEVIVDYNFELADAKTEHVIWTAQAVLYVHWNSGPTLANTAIEKMAADHMLDCRSAIAGHA